MDHRPPGSPAESDPGAPRGAAFTAFEAGDYRRARQLAADPKESGERQIAAATALDRPLLLLYLLCLILLGVLWHRYGT